VTNALDNSANTKRFIILIILIYEPLKKHYGLRPELSTKDIVGRIS